MTAALPYPLLCHQFSWRTSLLAHSRNTPDHLHNTQYYANSWGTLVLLQLRVKTNQLTVDEIIYCSSPLVRALLFILLGLQLHQIIVNQFQCKSLVNLCIQKICRSAQDQKFVMRDRSSPQALNHYFQKCHPNSYTWKPFNFVIQPPLEYSTQMILLEQHLGNFSCKLTL